MAPIVRHTTHADNHGARAADTTVVVGLLNWMAKSLDPSELSKEEALLLFMVLTRATAALWHSFERELLVLLRRHGDSIVNTILQEESEAVGDEDGDDDDDDEPDGSDGSDGSSSGGQPPLQ
jgi:hypothetical protein